MATVKSARHIGAFVRAERERAGLTQERLAARAGVSRRWLIATERGEHSRAEVGRLLDVLAALDVSVTLTAPATVTTDTAPVVSERTSDVPAAEGTATSGDKPDPPMDVDLDSHLARFRI